MESKEECLVKVFLEIPHLIKDNCYDFILGWWLVSKSEAEQRDSYTQCVERNVWWFEHPRRRSVSKCIFPRRMCPYRDDSAGNNFVLISFFLTTSPKSSQSYLHPYVLYASVDPNQALEHLAVCSLYIEPVCAEQANNFGYCWCFSPQGVFYNYNFYKYNFK